MNGEFIDIDGLSK